MTASSSDAELITAVRSGGTKAYGILYERHAPAARRLARQIVRRPADVDDVVAETFARVLALIRRGAGPAEAFRPYLLASARRVAFDQLRVQRDQIPTDAADLPDPGEPFVDPVLASLEHSLVARAFRSLPERWSAVLWHTEIEQARPAEIALLLGLTPNGVAALSYRAREGLKQAYLQLHLSSRARAECGPVAGRLGTHVRGGLSRRAARQVDSHLSGCADCRAAYADLATINGALRGLLAPAFLGAAAAQLSGAAPASAASRPIAAAAHWLARVLRHRLVVAAAASSVLTATMLTAVTLTHPHPGRPSPALARSARAAAPARTAASPSVSASAHAPAAPAAAGAAPQPSPMRLTAQLSVQVDVNGLLSLGLVTVVAVRVSDPGNAATGGLTEDLTLPAGTVLLGLVPLGSAGWSCGTAAAGTMSCAHGAIGAGAVTSLSFRVLVVSLAGCGKPILATVISSSLSATGKSAAWAHCGLP